MPFKQKPLIWTCDPGTVAYNCARLGLPMPVLALPMWEGSGSKVYDYSGQGNHGTIKDPDWQRGGLLIDDNNDSKIDVPAIPATNAVGSVFQIYTYTLMEPAAGYRPLFFTHNTGGINFRNHLGQLQLRFSNCQFDSSFTLTIGETYNICAGWRQASSEQFIFADKFGIESSNADFVTPGTYDIVIGNRSADTFRPANGIIYTTVLFKHYLTLTQVQTLNSNPYGLFEPVPRAKFWYVASGGTDNIKSVSGITWANVKSIGGVAKADIKKVGDLDTTN
jgi:hypothetical protein